MPRSVGSRPRGRRRPLVDEVRRLIDAGGKRLRPTFCYWGYRAAAGADDGAPDAPIVRAAAALELLHTMALVHDDLIDGAKERRGVPTTAAWFAERAEELDARGDPEWFGGPSRCSSATSRRSWRTGCSWRPGSRRTSSRGPRRVPPDARGDGGRSVPAGRGRATTGRDTARRAAALKGGGYTVEGPLRIGAALAGASAEVDRCLSRFGEPLGQAFQLRDDLDDGDADPGVTRAKRWASSSGRRRRPSTPTCSPPAAVGPLAELADGVAT